MSNERARILRKSMSNAELNGEGYRVLRFQTIDVYRNLGGVVDTIWAALQEE